MIIWNDEKKKEISNKIAKRLETNATTKLEEKYYEDNTQNIGFHVERVVEDIVERYFEKLDIEDVQDDLPDEMFDEKGYFKEKEYNINDEIRDLLESTIIEELTKILNEYVNDFDDSDPNDLATYVLSEKDFYITKTK